jgi:hypothetical protein
MTNTAGFHLDADFGSLGFRDLFLYQLKLRAGRGYLYGFHERHSIYPLGSGWILNLSNHFTMQKKNWDGRLVSEPAHPISYGLAMVKNPPAPSSGPDSLHII